MGNIDFCSLLLSCVMPSPTAPTYTAAKAAIASTKLLKCCSCDQPTCDTCLGVKHRTACAWRLASVSASVGGGGVLPSGRMTLRVSCIQEAHGAGEWAAEDYSEVV
jgi:hypothetical protein